MKTTKRGLCPWLRVVPDIATGCWNWTGYKAKGYGRIYHNGSAMPAHRRFYEMLKAAIPAGLALDHLCRNKACVNPGHLEAVTNEENVRRGIGPTANNARKTLCNRGHEYAWLPSAGKRWCRVCTVARTRGYRVAERKARKARHPDAAQGGGG